MIRTFSSSMTKSLIEDRVPKDSDFTDAIHSMYAPYVDIFRADSCMAPIVERHVRKFGVDVVQKLRALPSVIESRLNAKSPNIAIAPESAAPGT